MSALTVVRAKLARKAPQAIAHVKVRRAKSRRPHPSQRGKRNLVIVTGGGCVWDVKGLPKGWTYEVRDEDDAENERG